jgi:ABC-type antimicrobial peptide transport system permease subunit
MREVLLLIGTGVVIGMGGALLLTRYIEGQLLGITPNDPLTLCVAAAILVAVAAIAGYVSARRASRVDPIRALRYERSSCPRLSALR